MKKLFSFVLALAGFGLFVSAQKGSGTLKGVLQDSVSASPLTDATVSLVSLPDSTLISFTLTDNNGVFEIKNIAPGEYAVLSSYVGLRSLKQKLSISAANPVVDLGVVKLRRAEKFLDEVVITEAPVKVSGDTISYRADAFKTKPNATVEDLLKKLPGVQVQRDGTVKAQGENVQKVYVDGKEFFSNDPKLATKNLAADMVDRVEVYDDMSEQAKFSGIDDGSRAKAINLRLKKDRKKGVFGRAYAGGGTEDRYDAGITANYFKGATQANVIAKSNNTNNVGYTMSDMLGMFGGGGGGGMMTSGGGGGGFGSSGGGGGMIVGGGSGGGGMMMGGGRGGGNMSLGGFNIGGAGGGITRSSQAGLNYRDTWSRFFDVNGSYFYNDTRTDNQRGSFRQTFANDSTTFINQNETVTRNSSGNHRFNYNLVYSIDSFNSLIYQPAVNVQSSRSFSDDSLINRIGSKLLNQGRTLNDNYGEGYNFSNNLLWRHKFRKPGRTLSLALSATWNNNDRDGYITNNLTQNRSSQLSQTVNNAAYYGATLSYTEPIARDKILELNYSRNDSRNRNDRRTYLKNVATGAYDKIIESQTNLFENTNRFDRVGTNVRIVKKKYNYQLGFSVQQTELQSDNLSKNSTVLQRAINLFPTASFNYNFQRSRSLRINYRGRTTQPTASQLQEVLNRDNFPYTYIGNASLQQEFTHNMMVSYNFFDPIKFRNLFTFVTYQATANKIANSITTDARTGEQLTRPVNVSGVYNVSGNFNVGVPIKRMQGGNFNATTRVGYNQDVNPVNNQVNYNRNLSLGEDLRLSYNYKEKLDLSLSASVSYNRVKNTVQVQNNQSYFTHTYGADLTYTLPKNFLFSTDIDYNFNTGLEQGFNQNFAIWNASIAKQVLKNKRGEIKASVYDLLNQNTNVYRNATQNYIEDVRNSALRRYFMLTFTLNINRMGGRSLPMMPSGGGFRLN